MDDSLGGMFKLTSSNYSLWKSKMRDMLVVKDLWLTVQCGDKRPDKIDATTWCWETCPSGWKILKTS